MSYYNVAATALLSLPDISQTYTYHRFLGVYKRCLDYTNKNPLGSPADLAVWGMLERVEHVIKLSTITSAMKVIESVLSVCLPVSDLMAKSFDVLAQNLILNKCTAVDTTKLWQLCTRTNKCVVRERWGVFILHYGLVDHGLFFIENMRPNFFSSPTPCKIHVLHELYLSKFRLTNKILFGKDICQCHHSKHVRLVLTFNLNMTDELFHFTCITIFCYYLLWSPQFSSEVSPGNLSDITCINIPQIII